MRLRAQALGGGVTLALTNAYSGPTAGIPRGFVLQRGSALTGLVLRRRRRG